MLIVTDKHCFSGQTLIIERLVLVEKHCLSLTNTVSRLKLCISLDYRVWVEKQRLSSDKHCLSPKKVSFSRYAELINVRNTSRAKNSVYRALHIRLAIHVGAQCIRRGSGGGGGRTGGAYVP